MRRDARVDNNQAEIVEALRAVGATVQHLHTVGQGCPDILVGYEHPGGRRINLLMEIKSAKGKLTVQEHDWHRCWRGQVYVVRTVERVLVLLGWGAKRGNEHNCKDV